MEIGTVVRGERFRIPATIPKKRHNSGMHGILSPAAMKEKDHKSTSAIAGPPFFG
jgi:hypothetical protein